MYDHGKKEYTDKIKKMATIMNEGEGVDVIIEMFANKHLRNDIQMLNSKGTISVVGNRGEITVSPRNLMIENGKIKGVQ